ncbi:MAG: phosphate acetyltransferase [Nitrospirales bacterium]|nr:MAG: phosphate acetyltransferase [Nitrospirales bacterium]
MNVSTKTKTDNTAKPWGQCHRLIDLAKHVSPIRTAVVWPVDVLSLRGAVEAAHEKLIDPILIGDEQAIRNVAAEHGIDLREYELYDASTSTIAANAAVELARTGKVASLMKGALQTETLLRALIDADKELVDERRMSHVFVMNVPSYPKPLFVTDAAINIYPDLDDKRDIVQNAIDMARALDIETPKVAILSAIETVSSKIRSTVEAAALCKMAERGQITGGILDGPLAIDNAVSEEAAQVKGITSSVAGNADILVAPDLEAGNILAKQLEYLGGSCAAGIVLGARVPLILTSRADESPARIASCALAALLVEHAKREAS